MIKWFIVLAFYSTCFATTFRPTSMQDQMRSSDGVIFGHYLKSKSIKMDDGRIATQMFFKMIKEYGMNSELYGTDEVIVHYPGGKIDGVTSFVQGVPKFAPGEKIALFVRSVDNRYWGLNLGLGSFRVVNYGPEVMLINSLFPDDPKVGQVKLEDFEASVRSIKGQGMKTVLTPSLDEDVDRIPASVEAGKKRSIASASVEGENREVPAGISIYWLLTCLALLGAYYRTFKRKGA